MKGETAPCLSLSMAEDTSAKVTVVIVTWNSFRFLFDCVESLLKQTLKNLSIIVVDNGSQDITVPYLRKHYPQVTILQNFKNKGFSFANNQGIKLSKSKYILIMNPDVILEPKFLETLALFADNHTNGGSFCGKLLKIKTENIDSENPERDFYTPIKTSIIDSAGIAAHKDRSFKNRGEGENSSDKFIYPEQVFGVSGCCGLFRREALENIKIGDEYFDCDFFAYKEDVDLAYRLKIYGWEAWYIPQALGWHARAFSAPQKNLYASRKKISRFLRSLSFRNHYLVLLKNEYAANIFIHSFYILRREIFKLSYILLFEPWLLKTITQTLILIPKIYKKRKIIQEHKILKGKKLRVWFK